MVMKRNAMRKNLRQSIVKSFGRYIAISLIIGLGAALFVGLLTTKSDMVATGHAFMEEQNMFDLRMVSNYGWSEKYVEEFAQLEGVEDAEGLFYIDLIGRVGEDAEDSVYRFYTLPEKINKVALRGGRMPEAENECLAYGFYADDSVLGKTVTISDTNDEDTLETLRCRSFTVVGYVATPLYMDMNLGTTSVGSGSLANIYYAPAEAFDADYYTEINLTLKEDYAVYTDAYNDFLDDSMDALEPEAEKLSEQRFQDIKAEAEEEYADGYQEYLDGVKDFEDGKAEAEQELADAYQELLDAEEELARNRQKLIDAGKEIEEGREAIDVARGELLEKHSTCTSNLEQVNAAIPQAQAAVSQVEAAIGMSGSELKASLDTASQGVSSLQQALEAEKSAEEPDEEAIAALEQQLAAAQSQLDSLNSAYANYSAAAGALEELEGSKTTLQNAIYQINQGFAQLEEKLDTLNAAEYTLNVNWTKWHDGEKELAEGWEDYEEGKKEAEQEIADAEAELKDAEEELAEARADIDAMDKPDLIMLDRNSNVGYNNLDSSSDIVAGVSRIIPVFFLLVASLVCITTMTRMIDEERTQIGTLKALGYTNGEIMSKYLVYSGSGAVLGCSLGILVGSSVFPMIIWQAYCIMLYIQPGVILTVNWPLAIAVVLVYTAVMLLVTWHSCRRTLEEVPAELIRPKSPDPGKKILLEYFPFWHKVSFLNKVTIRNIFRYRQRLAMMMVGIGGCTALLLTGFGLRDSIVNVVDYQFEKVTHYDISVYFREEVDEAEKEEFLDVVDGKAEDSMFYHQSSVELEFDNRVKEIYMISGGSQLDAFISLHSGSDPIDMPGKDEVVLSVGVAENLNISVGDSVILRNTDMEAMELTVSGIYDNHVYNYAIVQPDTLESQWGSAPELQMAFVRMQEGQDVHTLGAEITDLDTVMNVSVSDDLAETVGGMMEALDLVVVVIVFCAGLLAVVVLYNLTNININERIREIATIKVLGFNASETAAYVFKENLTLTVAGSLFGLLLGKLLLMFVMSQIKIDMVWFQALTEPISYVWSVGLTLLSAVVVDFIFYFKLETINMAEALKSVE